MKSGWLVPLLALLGVSVALDLLLRRGEYGHWWYPVPGFFALLGLAGCVTIVVVSRFLGHHWLKKEENYYGEEEINE